MGLNKLLVDYHTSKPTKQSLIVTSRHNSVGMMYHILQYHTRAGLDTWYKHLPHLRENREAHRRRVAHSKSRISLKSPFFIKKKCLVITAGL